MLERAAARGVLDGLLADVAEDIARRVRGELRGLPPEERLLELLRHLDYGEMLAHLDRTPGGWELHAYNCVYRAAGERFEGVCDLLPDVVRRAAGVDAERVRCQRDGERTCHFAGGFRPTGDR